MYTAFNFDILTCFFSAVAARNIRARAQPPNSCQASIWANPIYVKQKNELMEAQLDESRSKAELNRAQTWAATEKAKFWERANAELNNNNLVLIMQSDTPTRHLHVQNLAQQQQQQQQHQQLEQQQQQQHH